MSARLEYREYTPAHRVAGQNATESGTVESGAAEQDLAAARALIAEAEAFDGTPPVSDQAMLAAVQGQRALLLFSETGSTGGPSARGPSTRWLPADETIAVGIIGQGEIDLVVRPSERGQGVGSAALASILDRSDRRLTGELRAWAHGDNPAAEALLQGAGFEPVRTLLRMVLDPSLLPGSTPDDAGQDPLALPTPAGLSQRAFDPDNPADARAWVKANAAAFATHPEQGRITEADFALIRREPWFDPADLILLAEDEGAESDDSKIAGSTWIKTVREPATGASRSSPKCEHSTPDSSPECEHGTHDSSPECELYAVGIRPEYAGRGLGRLLLEVTLARMAQHAPRAVSLYVDGENERAVRMYEHAAFTVDSSSRQWTRPALSEVDAKMDT